jgi:hypothetical protein
MKIKIHFCCVIISGRYFRDFSRVLSIGIGSHFETRKVSKIFNAFSTSILTQCSQICSPSDKKPNFGSLSNTKSRKQNTNQNFWRVMVFKRMQSKLRSLHWWKAYSKVYLQLKFHQNRKSLIYSKNNFKRLKNFQTRFSKSIWPCQSIVWFRRL